MDLSSGFVPLLARIIVVLLLAALLGYAVRRSRSDSRPAAMAELGAMISLIPPMLFILLDLFR